MKKLTVLLCSAVMTLGILLATNGQAQSATNNGLAGLDVFNLRIEKLSEDGSKCLLDREIFAETVNEKLANTGITVAEGSYPSLYIQVNTVSASDLCYSSVYANINYYAQVPHPKNPRGTLAQIVLWSDNYLVSSEKQAHQDYVKTQIQSTLDAFITDWKKQKTDISSKNPPVAKTP